MARPFAYLGNPSRFMRVSRFLATPLLLIGIIVTAIGLYWGVFHAPDDKVQGNFVKIIYIHVPSAWLAMMAYSLMAISALGTLVWRHPLADAAARAAAPIGAVFTALTLITGSLWGKPMWGTWWEWDARMTSVLVLLIMYLGLISLSRALDRTASSARLLAILTLVGAINIPIIKFSVDWWNTLHQPASVIRLDGPTIHADFLWPLIISAVGLTILFLALHLFATQTEVLRRRADALEIKHARETRRTESEHIGGPS